MKRLSFTVIGLVAAVMLANPAGAASTGAAEAAESSKELFGTKDEPAQATKDRKAVQTTKKAAQAKKDAKAKKTKKAKKGKKGKDAADGKDTTATKKVSKYERAFVKDRKCVSARAEDGFMALHKTNGKIYAEMKKEYFGREVLLASTITGSSAPDLASIGYKPTAPIHVKFVYADSTVYLCDMTLPLDFNQEDEALVTAWKRNSRDAILGSYKIHSYNADSSAVVFDVSNLFAANYAPLAPITSGSSGGVNIQATYNPSGFSLGQIKAFKDNVTIKATFSYTVTADMMKLIALKNKEPFSVDVTRTVMLIPEKKMRPRLSDTRVGTFLCTRADLDSDDKITRYSVVKRWNIQPSDTAAWQRGELVEPVKPIVYYLDDAFPKAWREPIRRGALRWNKAFEKIGFKNVIQVRDFPQDDPEFDPDNLKYSCIRYVPAQIANAMGPSWCDPFSGEIYNASVIVYNDILKVINDWRFVQTAQADPRVRSRRLPQDVFEESLEYVIAHEVGHTLGFMHNMAASSAYPTEKLRNAEFSKANGTTPSIMDYARFNYIAKPGDTAAGLTPPFLGPYDYWLVEFAYRPVIEASNAKEDSKVVTKWVDEKAGDPLYRYGRQQVQVRYDPTAIEEDLGDDPVKSATYGVENLKYILRHFDEWMDNDMDPDATLREYRYEALAKQYNRYLSHVMANIGGVKLDAVKPGTQGRTAKAIDRKRQKESLEWVVNQLKTCDWIENRELTDKFSLRLELHTIFQYYTALELFETSQKVLLSSRIADSPQEAYTLQDWCDDLYKLIWDSAISHRKMTDADRILQSLHVTYLTGIVTKKSQLVKVSSSSAWMPSVDEMISFGLDRTGLVEKYAEELRDLDEQNGRGYVASKMLEEFGPAGYNMQYRLNLRTVDNSKELFHGELLRLQKLLKSAATSSSKEEKAHYQALLFNIDTALNEK